MSYPDDAVLITGWLDKLNTVRLVKKRIYFKLWYNKGHNYIIDRAARQCKGNQMQRVDKFKKFGTSVNDKN